MVCAFPSLTIVKLVAAGKSDPDLEGEDIKEALQYAARLAEDKIVEIATNP